MQISFVPAESVDSVWETFRPQILKALTKGAGEHQTEEFFREQVKSGAMVMLIAHDDGPIACGILSVINYTKHKVLFIELLAGKDLDSWLPSVETILKQYRDQIGATTIEASCRPGFVKKLANWQRKAVLMELR